MNDIRATTKIFFLYQLILSFTYFIILSIKCQKTENIVLYIYLSCFSKDTQLNIIRHKEKDQILT